MASVSIGAAQILTSSHYLPTSSSSSFSCPRICFSRSESLDTRISLSASFATFASSRYVQQRQMRRGSPRMPMLPSPVKKDRFDVDDKVEIVTND